MWLLETLKLYMWLMFVACIIFIFLKDFIYFYRERGRKGEREGEKYHCVVASCTPPTGDLAHNPGMCPDWESNLWFFALQSSAQSTEPAQPGLWLALIYMGQCCFIQDYSSCPTLKAENIASFNKSGTFFASVKGISSNCSAKPEI